MNLSTEWRAWLRRAQQPSRRAERRLERRLLVGGLVGGLAAIPFAGLTVLVRGRWAPLRRLDQSVAHDAYELVHDRPGLLRTLDVGSVVLDPWVFRGATAILAIALARHGARRLAWWAVVTMTVGGLVGVGMKYAVARARPVFDDPLATALGFSFPSGHAVNSMLGTAVLLLVLLPLLPGPRSRALAWAVGALVVLATGVDRVGLGVHYTSDVVGGWICALAVLAGTVTAFETWRTHEGEPATAPLHGLDPDESRQLTS